MGRPKLLLSWGETSVLGHLITQWQALEADQITVVYAADDSVIPAELDRLGFPRQDRIANPKADNGMFSSIVCAARWPDWQASLTHWAIVLGDQPHLRRETLQQLVRFAAEHPTQVCQPIRNGRRGHPVVLPNDVFLELAKSRSADLKNFLLLREVASCECDDPGLDLDIDRPEDYQQALMMAGLTAQ
jgi:molybdenum cofactor cytidylyltransferase